MNLKKLKQAEEGFFDRYPGGFANPEMIAIRKKHKLEKMIELAQGGFAKRNFKLPDLIVENMIKVITRSSLISVFEKPKFRDFARSLASDDRKRLTGGLGELLHGNEQIGFEAMLEVLKSGRLAKWSLMTICQAYYRPQVEVFVKPTTAKDIIETFELKKLQYHPTPTWAFYNEYRAEINEMKSKVDASLSPYNVAFTGFLMRSMQEDYFNPGDLKIIFADPLDKTTQTQLTNLWTDDRDEQNKAYVYMLEATNKPVDWAYEVWDKLLANLTHKNNHNRAIAAQILSNLAKSDPKNRMLKDFDKLLIVTKDERFVTARHCLQSLWKVGVAGQKQQKVYMEGLERRFKECVTEKNYTLIRYDIIRSMRNVYDVVKDEKIKKKALELLEREENPKYRKKYAGLWKK